MQGKYTNLVRYSAAWLHREVLRARLARVVQWSPLTEPEAGCTAIIGMCSRLPHVLEANLRCLYAARWDQLRRIVITVDATEEAFPSLDVGKLRLNYPGIDIDVLYYSSKQSATAELHKLPYVYSWMSWCIALAEVRTRDVLIHDYDALVLGTALADRHREYCRTNVKYQGVKWYMSNGIVPEDRLGTTFEAFADAVWLRSFAPVLLFNKVGMKGRRSVDYDTALYLQDRFLTLDERGRVPMSKESLVHPSQMIHQYTMFRRQPGQQLPSFSMPMLPYFEFLAGNRDALRRATKSLLSDPRDAVDLANDGTRMNLSELIKRQVDWQLKEMIQGLLGLNIPPDRSLMEYGTALYQHLGVPPEQQWEGDFTEEQLAWMRDARG